MKQKAQGAADVVKDKTGLNKNTWTTFILTFYYNPLFELFNKFGKVLILVSAASDVYVTR